MSIAYLRHGDIDTSKWDKCIKRSFNATIYAYSWYLDLFCDQWDALVENDYLSVMPLMKKHVLGHDIICTSYLVRELGVFSRKPVHAEKTLLFLKSIPSQFKYYNIVLNKYNPLEHAGLIFRRHKHYTLDLIRPYYSITRTFTPELRSKLNRSAARHLNFVKGLAPNDLILFLKAHKIHVEKQVSEHNYRVLRALMAALIRNRTGELFGTYNEHNDLTSVALLALVGNRIIVLFHVADQEQIHDSPHLFLIDRIIEKYSETNSVLSFEVVSDQLRPEAYLSFGASETTLLEVANRRLPFYMRPFLKYG